MECKKALFVDFVVNVMANAVIKVRCAELPRQGFLCSDLHQLPVTSTERKNQNIAQKIIMKEKNYREKLTATI